MSADDDAEIVDGELLPALNGPMPRLTPTGLDLPPNMPYVEWEAYGHTLRGIGESWQWAVGDWINYGEHNYGEKYAQALDVLGLTYAAATNYAWVAGKFSTRVENLSWTHHRAVAKLSPPEQALALERAQREGLSAAALQVALKTPGEPESTADERFAFVTELRILHTSSDTSHAEAWTRRLVARLTAQGATVTQVKTKPR